MKNKWQYSTYSKIDEEIIDYFPFESAREGQLETISEIKEAISKGYKYIVLEAGTGTGKSAIAATLALMSKKAYILTVTKQLQKQYLEDFGKYGFKLIKGRGNYPCINLANYNIDESCDYGLCLTEGHNCKYNRNVFDFERCLNEKCCEYKRNKSIALNSQVVITNYAYAQFEFNINDDFGKRELMIFDEAHNLESSVMDLLTLEFNKKKKKNEIGFQLTNNEINNLKNGNSQTWIGFIKKIRQKYLEEKAKFSNFKDKKGVGKIYRIITKKIDDFNNFIRYIQEKPDNWVIDEDKRFKSIYIKPIMVNNYCEKILFKYGDVCLFLSATILDCDRFARDLGINHEDIYAIRRKTPFDIGRNPIKLCSGINLSYSTINQNAPLTIDYIKNILNAHKNDKGIIHTVSYQCKNFLMKNLDDDRLLDHNTRNRERILKKFEKSNDPLVLISPSMGEGVDLPGDKCRFQIIYKLPYKSLANKQTKARMDIDDSWYKYKTSINLIQIHGRGMRSSNDYCTTYFIDGRLEDFILKDSKNYGFLPDTFKNAINVKQSDITENVEEILVNLPKNRKINEFLKEVSENDYLFEGYDEVTDDVIDKANLIEEGLNLIKKKYYDDAKLFYKNLIDDKLFSNDYYPYLKLLEIYGKTKEHEKEFKTINCFFESGKNCSNGQLAFFKFRLKKIQKYLSFDFDIYNQFKEKFKEKGALNTDNSCVVADRIKIYRKIHLISQKEYDEQMDFMELEYNYKFCYYYSSSSDALYYFEKLWDKKQFNRNLTAYKRLCGFYEDVGDWKSVIRVANDYFESDAKVTKSSPSWFKEKIRIAESHLSKENNFSFNLVDVDDKIGNYASLNEEEKIPAPKSNLSDEDDFSMDLVNSNADELIENLLGEARDFLGFSDDNNIKKNKK